MRKLLLALALLVVGGVLSAPGAARHNQEDAILDQRQDTVQLKVWYRGVHPLTGKKLDRNEKGTERIPAWTLPEAAERAINSAAGLDSTVATDPRLYFRFRNQQLGVGKTELLGLHMDRPNLYEGASVDEVIITAEYDSLWWLNGGDVPGFDPASMDFSFLLSLASWECVKCGAVRLCAVDPVCAN